MSVQSTGNPRRDLRRLTKALGELRSRTGLPNAALAKLADTNPATLSRLLTGEFSRPPVPVVARLARVFADLGLFPPHGLTGEDLVSLANSSQKTGWKPWWHRYKDVVGDVRADYLALESEVIKIQSFSVQNFPELLQTPAYAEAALRTRYRQAPDTMIAQWLEVRAYRQQLLLESSSPTDLWALFDESALHRRALDPVAMADQLDWLVKLAGHDHIKVAMIPYTAGLYDARADYAILTFQNPLDQDLVLMESHKGEEWIETPDQVNEIRDSFERLFALALPAHKTVAAIKAARAALPV